MGRPKAFESQEDLKTSDSPAGWMVTYTLARKLKAGTAEANTVDSLGFDFWEIEGLR